jgi:hypothetical protein
MNLEQIAKNLTSMAKEVKADKGPLELLGLFLRDDSPDLWDLVVAAPWLKVDERASFVYVADQLRSFLTPEELANLSRIVILEHGGAVLASFLKRFTNHAGLADIHFVADGGAIIRRAYIILAHPLGSGRRHHRR